MSMIIELKDGLTPPPAIVYTQDETNYNYGRNVTDNFCIDPLRDWAKELGSPVEYRKPLPYEIIENDTASDGTMLGKGFLSHLSKAYSQHYKIAVNPQDFWFIVVCEIAAIVAESPKLTAAFSRMPRTSKPSLCRLVLTCCRLIW